MVMPYIPQRVLSSMWKSYSKAPVVWITAVKDVPRLRNELSKYLSKRPAAKVTYSRDFPAAAPLVVSRSGPCEACDGREHTFMFISVREAEDNFSYEEAGRRLLGESVTPTGVVGRWCGCWPDSDDPMEL